MRRLRRIACSIALVPLFSPLPVGFSETETPNEALKELPISVQGTLQRAMAGVSVHRIDVEKSRGGTSSRYEIEIEDQDNIRYWLVISDDGRLLKKMEEGQLSVLNGRLLKEEEPFWIQAIHRPDSGNPEAYPEDFRKSVYVLSEVGANTLSFDLFGLASDGSALSEEALDHHLHRIVVELLEYQMSGVCRVLGRQPAKGAAVRMAAVRTAAKAFQNEPQLVYWIDGEGAEDLVAEFKRIAPQLAVAGPGGDLDVLEPRSGAASAKPVLWLRPVSDYRPGTHHLMLKDQPESYRFLDERNRWPVESEPWEPDNSVLSEAERGQGFMALFDGKTLAGWASITKGKESFVAKDGNIEWVRRGAGAIQFHRRFADFILRFEYRIEDGGNSGVHLRSPRSNRASRIGFEVQLYGDFGEPPTKHRTGAIYDVIAPKLNASRPAGEWNSVEITASGPQVKVELNGQIVQNVNFDDYPELRDRLRRGFIRLTDHGDYAAFRNIRIKEL